MEFSSRGFLTDIGNDASWLLWSMSMSLTLTLLISDESKGVRTEDEKVQKNIRKHMIIIFGEAMFLAMVDC
jgi:hypothetical protein